MARLDIAWRGLTCRFVTPATAGRGLAWPQACGRWLPVWLPAISLAMLTLGCQTAFLRADLEEPCVEPACRQRQTTLATGSRVHPPTSPG